MAKTNYPSITPLTPTVGQSEITFRFNVTSFNEISELYWEVCNEEDPTSTIASGYLENDHDFWPYGVNFEIEITELEYNSGSYICRLSATNSNGTTESTQKCTLEQYIDWAEPESVLAGNRFIANGSEEIGSLPAIDQSEIVVDGSTVTIPVGIVTQTVSVQADAPDFITFTARQANSSLTVRRQSTDLPFATLYYSTDRKNWKRISNEQVIPLENEGSQVYIYGNNPDGVNARIQAAGKVACTGNILALIDKSGEVTSVPSRAFSHLFENSYGLVSSPDLYKVKIATRCFDSMFWNCTSLTEAPQLPATTLDYGCYSSMFYGCSSLTESPVLPAAVITGLGCFASMFRKCTSLNKIVCYVTEWDSGAATNWVTQVAPTGDFYNLGGATIPTGTNGIPSGWTEHNSL